jgi:hypothetical protein
MTVLTSYAQTLVTNVTLGVTQYAVVIPAANLSTPGFTIGAWRITLEGGAAPISHMWAGPRGTGTVDFDGSQQQLKFNNNNGATIPASGNLVSDPIAGSLDLTKDFVVVFDGTTTSGNYKKLTGLASVFRYHYKAGLGGTNNGNNTRTGFEASANGVTAFVAKLEVAESLADFGAAPPQPTGSNGMAEILANKMFASGGVLNGVANTILQASLFNPSATGINAFPKQIVITPEADTIISCRTIVGISGTLVPSACNLNFGNGTSPASKAKVYTRTQSDFTGDTAQHSIFKIKAGVPFAINNTNYPLAALAPGGVGFCVAIHEKGIGCTITFEWQEEPL